MSSSILCKWCHRENCTYDCPPNSTCKHYIGSANVVIDIPQQLAVTKCLLCGDEIIIGVHDSSTQVCERCKNAFLKLRDFIENISDALLNHEQKRKKEKELLKKLEKTEEGKLIAKGYKDYINFGNNDYTDDARLLKDLEDKI